MSFQGNASDHSRQEALKSLQEITRIFTTNMPRRGDCIIEMPVEEAHNVVTSLHKIARWIEETTDP